MIKYRDDDLKKKVSGRKIVLKVISGLTCLYFFVCSLDLLATSFPLLSGRNGAKLFSNSIILRNPIVGIMIGVVSTVIVQSSSTTSSVIVGLVAANFLEVKAAIPMIMGTNVGTSATSTVVSLMQIGKKEEFNKAFACAVLHDMFNWLSAILFLAIEVLTGYLNVTSTAIVKTFHITTQSKPGDFLAKWTKPFTKKIIQIDREVLHGWTLNSSDTLHIETLLKSNCRRLIVNDYNNITTPIFFNNESMMEYEDYQCGYIFARLGLDDIWIGVILLIGSLALLTICLLLFVRILKSLMEYQVLKAIRGILDTDFPRFPWLTGYLAILIGTVITVFVQSSSVFTATLTPLVATGLFKLERAYPLTLGANIGTTTTGLLAALATESGQLEEALRIALCHLLFNISGILVFYPIPFMRWPIPMAKAMGNTVEKFKWFSVFYLFFAFGVFPMYIFGLSLLVGPSYAMYCGFLPPFLVFILVILMNVIQTKAPYILPEVLRDWEFLPEWMRSFAPLDRLFKRLNCFNSCKKSKKKRRRWETILEEIGQEMNNSS